MDLLEHMTPYQVRGNVSYWQWAVRVGGAYHGLRLAGSHDAVLNHKAKL